MGNEKIKCVIFFFLLNEKREKNKAGNECYLLELMFLFACF
jgi:hypothetical protein